MAPVVGVRGRKGGKFLKLASLPFGSNVGSNVGSNIGSMDFVKISGKNTPCFRVKTLKKNTHIRRSVRNKQKRVSFCRNTEVKMRCGGKDTSRRWQTSTLDPTSDPPACGRVGTGQYPVRFPPRAECVSLQTTTNKLCFRILGIENFKKLFSERTTIDAHCSPRACISCA